MKKILISLSIITVAAVIVVGATTAFFSDTETSTGNTFTAGAIDLGVDNTSYYNGVATSSLSWGLDWDLSKNAEGQPEAHQFFNFLDLKPGDWGEDTISLHVNNNPAYLCVDVSLTKNDDVSSTEPELGDNDVANDAGNMWDGELAQNIKWYWWTDDGDNVYEVGENLLNNGVTFPNQAGTYHVALADKDTNVWGLTDNITGGGAPIPGGQPLYIAKAWCFGDSTFTPYPQTSTDGPNVRKVNCDGSQENNVTQTDSMTLDLAFRAVQARNNENFRCVPPQITRIDRTQQGFGDGGWAGWSCPANTTAVSGGIVSSTNPVGGNGVAAPSAPAVDGFTYPVYPHYTFPSGETGYVVHDLPGDGLGNTISFFVNCQAN